jgi:hypothetical protein
MKPRQYQASAAKGALSSILSAHFSRTQHRQYRLQPAGMNQPGQEFTDKTDTIEFVNRKHLANCPNATERQASQRLGCPYPIAHMKL